MYLTATIVQIERLAKEKLEKYILLYDIETNFR